MVWGGIISSIRFSYHQYRDWTVNRVHSMLCVYPIVYLDYIVVKVRQNKRIFHTQYLCYFDSIKLIFELGLFKVIVGLSKLQIPQGFAAISPLLFSVTYEAQLQSL